MARLKLPLIETKYPLYYVKGDNITPEQAIAVIIGTSNNYTVDDQIKPYLKNKSILDRTNLDFGNCFHNNNFDYIDYSSKAAMCNAYDFWCDFDGTILNGRYDLTVGKYLESKDILNAWKIIAKKFPFLNLKCQIVDFKNIDDYSKFYTTKFKSMENSNIPMTLIISNGEVTLDLSENQKLLYTKDEIDNRTFVKISTVEKINLVKQYYKNKRKKR